MNYKIIAALALVTGGAASVCTSVSATEKLSDPARAIYTDSYLESKKVAPISYKNLVLAHLSARYREHGTVDKNFADELEGFLGFTLPDFNRVYHARKLSGMRTEAESDESIIAKFRPAVLAASPASEVYVDVPLSLSIVNQGRLVSEYDSKVSGLEATYTIDEYPVESGAQFANDDHATRIVLNPARFKITVPYAKPDFQRDVYDAISNNRGLKKSYRVRLVLKITACQRKSEYGYSRVVACTPQLTSYQLFDGAQVSGDRLMKAAIVRLER